MAGSTEQQVTIAFVNLGLVEAAVIGKNAQRHFEDNNRILKASSVILSRSCVW